MKIAIKVDRKGFITGHTTVSGDSIPQGYNYVTEIDGGIYITGPNTVPSYIWDGERIVPRTKKDVRKDIKRIRLKKRKQDALHLVGQKGPLHEARESTQKLTELLLFGVVLALIIGVTSSSLFSLMIEFSPKPLIILMSAVVLAIILFIFSSAKLIPKKKYVEAIPSALAFNTQTQTVSLPKVIRMSRRLGRSTPLIISAISTYNTLAETQKKNEDGFRQYDLTLMLTITKIIHSFLNLPSSLEPRSILIDKGPFSSISHFGVNWYYLQPIQDSVETDSDLSIIQDFVPSIRTFRLPIGMTLRIGLSDKSKGFLFSSRGVSLRFQPFSGSSMPALYSQWKREFDGPKDKVFIHALSFLVTFEFSPLFSFPLRRRNKRGFWSTGDYVEWLSHMIDWMRQQLDWLEDESTIPDYEAFDLVDSSPPHYRCRVGDIGLGARDIVFDI